MAIQTAVNPYTGIDPYNPTATSTIVPSGTPSGGGGGGTWGDTTTKPTSVVSPTAAIDNLATIKTDHANIVQGMTAQQEKIKTQAQIDAEKKVASDQTAKDQAMKQQEIDQKGAAAKTLADAQNQQLLKDKGIDPANSDFWTSNPDYAKNLAALKAGTYTAPTTTPTPTETKTSGTTTPAPAETKTPEQLSIEADELKKADIDAKLTAIENGTFVLSPDEQAQINSLKSTYGRMIDDQKLANKNYEAGITQLGITSGRARYAGEMEMGNIQTAVNDGLRKVSKIEADMTDAVAKMTEAFKTNDYKMITEQYNRLNQGIKDKKQAIADAAKAVNEEADRLVKKTKEEQDAQTALLNAKKLKLDILDKSGVMPTIKESMTGDITKDKETIDAYAKYFGLDSTEIYGKMQAEKQKASAEAGKQDLTMSGKGYRTINPADAAKVRAQGEDVITISGRTYAKPAETKIITIGSGKNSYKALVDSKGNVIKRVGGGNIISSNSSTPKPGYTISKKDISAINQALAGAAGSDGKVSPDDYAAAKQDWISRGGTPTQFDTAMRGYRNPKNKYYNIGK